MTLCDSSHSRLAHMVKFLKDVLVGSGFLQNWRAPWASPVAQSVKNTFAVRELQVRSLGGEDPLEEGMVTHSSVLAWRIPWTEEPGRPQSIVSQRVGHGWSDSASPHLNGNSLWGGIPGEWKTWGRKTSCVFPLLSSSLSSLPEHLFQVESSAN